MLVLTRKVGQVITLGNPLSPEKAIEIKSRWLRFKAAM